MATRPLAFGVRLRDKRSGRTVRVLQDQRDPRRYRVEDSRKGGKTQQREHASLAGALSDLASSWRKRLHWSVPRFREAIDAYALAGEEYRAEAEIRGRIGFAG